MSGRVAGAASLVLADLENRPFFAAVSTLSRSAATHMPRPGSLRARSGVTTPSGPATNRISASSAMTWPETMSRRSREAWAWVAGAFMGIRS